MENGMGLKLPDGMVPERLSADQREFITSICEARSEEFTCSDNDTMYFKINRGQNDVIPELIEGILIYRRDAIKVIKQTKQAYEDLKELMNKREELHNKQITDRDNEIDFLKKKIIKMEKSMTSKGQVVKKEVHVEKPVVRSEKVISTGSIEELIINMAINGMSQREIAEKLNIGRGKVYNTVKEYKERG